MKKVDRQYSEAVRIYNEHPDWGIPQIAKAMDICYHEAYILFKRYDFEVDPRKTVYCKCLCEDDKEELVSLFLEGKTVPELMEYYGVKRRAVREVLISYNIMEKETRWNYTRELYMVNMVRREVPMKNIALVMGLTERSAKRKYYTIRTKYKTNDINKLVEIISAKLINYEDKNQETVRECSGPKEGA